MKLDPRIKKDKRPLSCFDTEQAKEFLGKECYLSNSIADYADLNNVTAKRILDDVSNTSIPYSSNPAGIYFYCLPCEWVKEPEKKYRPYTIKDFEKAFLDKEFDDFIIFRDKHDHGNVYTMRYNGNYVRGKYEYICLGAKNYSFESLFENYEVADYDGDWQPFGVIDEEGVGE